MPVFESHLGDYGEWKTGSRMCEERQRLGLTLQELASRCGLSIARLSQIENGLSIPDVEQAHDIARALNLSLDFFLPSDRALPYQLARYREVTLAALERDRFARVRVMATGGSLRWSTDGAVASPADSRAHTTVTSSSRTGIRLRLEGQVEFVLKTAEGEHREELQRGDCIYIRAHHLHAFRCVDAHPAECIHVLSSPSAGGLSGFEWLPDTFAGRRNGDGPGKGVAPFDSELPTLLGAELAALRRARGWTTAELAQIARIKRAAGGTGRERRSDSAARRAGQIRACVRETPARTVARPARRASVLFHSTFVRNTGPAGAAAARPDSPPRRANAQQLSPAVRPVPNGPHLPLPVRIRNIDMQMLVPHDHHGQEFVYVLSGEIELVTYAEDQKVCTVLGAGDSCFLDATSSAPAARRDSQSVPASSAELIDVYWCSLGERYLFDTSDGGIGSIDPVEAAVRKAL